MMLTVFTPAYNRSAYLNRLYESLVQQENKDFEWLIVDDGSTDDTAQQVRSFMDRGELTIRYCHKPNGGKHTAYNLGLEQAAGEWFICVDADDQLSQNAVAEIAAAVATAPKSTAIAAYKSDMDGNRLSDSFPEGVDRCKISDLPLKLGCRGEFTFIFPTNIAKKYPVPVFDGERFVGENVVYDRLEQECPVELLPRVVTLCEYLGDGYSMNFGKLMGKNPSGFCLYFMQRIDLMPTFGSRVSCAGKYWSFRWISQNRSLVYGGKHRLAWCLGWILGLCYRAYYKFVRGF